MIEHLQIGRAAYFYKRKRRLSHAAITRLFQALRSNADAPSKNLFSAVRVQSGPSTYSAICFSFERPPSFLDSEAEVVERIFGFLLVVEREELVAVFKSGLDLPSSFKSDYLEKIGGERVERAIARNDAVFQKLRLRNMSVSKLALRSKTLEASDLQNAIPIASASRFVPQAWNVERDDGNYSATPTTGRIAVRADRTGIEEIVAWAGQIMDSLLSEEGATSAFIRSFARPLELATLPMDVRPTYLAVDVPGLEDRLSPGDERTIRLIREHQGEFVEMTRAEIDALKDDLGQSFPIENARTENRIVDPDSRGLLGTLRVGKTRISLSITIPANDRILVEDASLPVGTDPDKRPLARYLDREDLFTVLFSDLALAYIDGFLFRDEALGGGGADFLRRLQIAPSLSQANSEKGDFRDGQQEFSDGSVFRVVADEIASDATVLLCDDLGNEWADFIGFHTVQNPAMVSFYHAKHGRRSLSASAFHEAVGQAIKNLGHMALPAETIPAKLDSWERTYRNDGAVTGIPRILRGGGRNGVERAIDQVRSAPDMLKRVFIVTSSLSRAQVEEAFAGASQGQPPSPHFVQLYWLLTSYFSACAEMGAVGYVVCQP